MNILVIRFSSMGDVILTTPVFSFLRARYPNADVTLLTDEQYVSLFADDPRLSRVVGIPKRTDPASRLKPAQKWDMVVDLQNSRRSRALVKTLKSAAKGAFDKLHWKRFALLVLRQDTYDPNLHVAARFVVAAGGTGATPPAPLLYFDKKLSVKAFADFIAETGGIIRPAIALFPFSAWKNKEWPEKSFLSVARYFLSKGWSVAIMGGPDDVDRAETMQRELGGRSVALAGKLSLKECGMLLSGFSLALGNDSGLSHLSRAVGVKTGFLYGPTTSHFGFFPYGAPPFVIFEEKLRCRPCHAHGGHVCLRLDRRCMKRISPRRVIHGLEELLRK